MHPVLKYRLKRFLSAVGITARAGGKPHTDLGEFAVFLRDLGFRPGTVIDVGVADGTFELYEAFPDSFHLLIEPMKEFEAVMKHICKRYRADYVIAAASNSCEERSIYFSGDKHASSLLPTVEVTHRKGGQERKVPSVRLDQLVKERKCEPPFLIKIDVQGFEHVVLEGATRILDETEMIVLETALFRFKEKRPVFDETIAFMKK